MDCLVVSFVEDIEQQAATAHHSRASNSTKTNITDRTAHS